MSDPEPHTTRLWQCPNCGQVHFGDDPPDMCDYCHDFTTWHLLSEDVSEARSLLKAMRDRRQKNDNADAHTSE